MRNADRPGETPPPKRRDIQVIDTMMDETPGLTAAFLIPADRPALVETGTHASAQTVCRALHQAGVRAHDLAWIIVTHVHLDHAGGAGRLALAFPRATIVAHPLGVPHLIDPRRLLASAARVPGAPGEPSGAAGRSCMQPIRSQRVRAAVDNERIDLGDRALEVLFTPGHARHHLALYDEESGSLFAGDAVGVQLASARGIRPATPPPDFDPKLARRSLHDLLARAPRRLLLTHFGEVGDPVEVLTEAIARLDDWVQATEAWASAPPADLLDDPLSALTRSLHDALGPAEARARIPETAIERLNGYASNAAGLLRWIHTVRDTAGEC